MKINKTTKIIIELFAGFVIGFVSTLGLALALIVGLFYFFDAMWLLTELTLDKYKYIGICVQILIFFLVTIAYLRESIRTSDKTSFKTIFRNILLAIFKALLANLIFYLALYFIVSVFYSNPLLIFIPPSVYLGYRFLKNNKN